MNKKGLLCILICIVMLMTSCAKKSEEKTASSESVESAKKLVFVVTGQLGDKSFNDSANRGVQEVAQTLGYETKVIEIGREQTKWLPTFEDLADSNEYDIIITNGSNAGELITTEVAPNYPDQKFILFDTTIDDSNDNVYAMSYRHNEASYLAGVLAAMVTKSDMENANSEKKIGFIGGSECPIISDFLVGYIQGAKSVDSDIICYVSYIGSWDDTAKGKETAIAQFNQGVDITFPAAEQAGLGCVEAAVEMGKYIIGVDSDQAMLFDETSPEKANVILTSVLKQVDKSIVRAVDKNDNNTLPWGTFESLGLAEGGVGLAINKYYERNIPQNIKDAVISSNKTIDDGSVIVISALTDSTEEVATMINSVSPKN
jgi:basic membrane protein A